MTRGNNYGLAAPYGRDVEVAATDTGRYFAQGFTADRTAAVDTDADYRQSALPQRHALGDPTIGDKTRYAACGNLLGDKNDIDTELS